MRILVVEDEPSLNALIAKKLTAEGYSVDACLSGTDAGDYLACAEYDAILLDILLPGMSGLELLRQIRSRGDRTPVLLLTAKDGVQDRVEGLDRGADDYLVKPFSFDELLARIRVMLRRSADNTANVDNVFTLADLKVDSKARAVTRGGTPIALSSKEFSILEYLIRNCGTVLSRERISAHIWNYEYEGGSNVVDVYIRYLRRKLDEGFSPKLIHTVRGAGYVLKREP